MAEHKFTIPPSRGCYAKGCRCDACKDIKRREQNAYRKRNPGVRNREKGKPYTRPTEARLRHLREADRRRYHAKRAQRLAVKRAYRARNAAKYRTLMAQWCKTEKGRAANLTKQARRRSAIGVTTPEQLRARWDYYGGRCYLCGAIATCTDHVIPIARGGTHWPANLRPACKSCNSRKHARTLSEYLAIRHAA